MARFILDLTEFEYKPAPHVKIKLALGGHKLRCEHCGATETVPENGGEVLDILNALGEHPFPKKHAKCKLAGGGTNVKR